MKMNRICVSFPTKALSLKAIKRSIHDFSEEANVQIISEDNYNIKAEIIINEVNKLRADEIETEFRKIVHEHQIFLDVEEEYKQIRQIIVAQAFFPCDNLDKIFE